MAIETDELRHEQPLIDAVPDMPFPDQCGHSPLHAKSSSFRHATNPFYEVKTGD